MESILDREKPIKIVSDAHPVYKLLTSLLASHGFMASHTWVTHKNNEFVRVDQDGSIASIQHLEASYHWARDATTFAWSRQRIVPLLCSYAFSRAFPDPVERFKYLLKAMTFMDFAKWEMPDFSQPVPETFDIPRQMAFDNVHEILWSFMPSYFREEERSSARSQVVDECVTALGKLSCPDSGPERNSSSFWNHRQVRLWFTNNQPTAWRMMKLSLTGVYPTLPALPYVPDEQVLAADCDDDSATGGETDFG
jgi:hypothetical protein